jgi:AcrR family transcriptional regulator
VFKNKMPDKKVKRVQPSATETREKLLQAAIQVFSESGYEGSTVRMICRRAGVNIALVNYHFGDKLALYRAVIRYVTDSDAKMELIRRAAEEGSSPQEALRLLIRSLLERLIAKKAQSGLHFRLMLNELAKPTTVLTDEIEATIRPLYDHVRAAVGAILQLPADHVKTRLCTHSIIGQIAHYIHARPILARLWPEMQFSPEQTAMVANHIADFSLAYLEPTKKPVSTRTAKKPQRKPK